MSPPAGNPFLEGQFALYLKMCKVFNPTGFLPLPECLQKALETADDFRTRHYEGECRIFQSDVKYGICHPTSQPPTVWSDEHHSNVVRCLLKQSIDGTPDVIRRILEQSVVQSDSMLHKLKRVLIDAEQKAIGGITEEDIKIATEIEFEMASSYVFM